MSYADFQIEASLTAADIGPAALVVTPGYRPITVRAVAVVITTTTSVAPNVFTINNRPTAGSAAGAVAVDTLTVPTGTTAGSVIYLDGLEFTCPPGGDVQVVGNDGATGAGVVTLMYEPSWETPANNADMTETA